MNGALRKKNGEPPLAPVHGWLILDKPLGLTSTQALGKARRLLGGRKAGHGGTLDPLATGVLPLAFGEATKLIPYVMDGRKEYDFTIHWGEARATDDAEGAVTATSDLRPDERAIRAAIPSFVGVIDQTPPIYSAIKVEGARAYDLARAGEAVALQARQITIESLDLIGLSGPDEALFHVACGKGTYVRSLARDLSIKLGTYGYVSALRRTRVGPFTAETAIPLEKLEDLGHKNAASTALLALRAALDDIPDLQLTASEAQRLRAGLSLLIRPHQMDLMKQKIILAEYQGVPVALVEAKQGAFCVVRGFNF